MYRFLSVLLWCVFLGRQLVMGALPITVQDNNSRANVRVSSPAGAMVVEMSTYSTPVFALAQSSLTFTAVSSSVVQGIAVIPASVALSSVTTGGSWQIWVKGGNATYQLTGDPAIRYLNQTNPEGNDFEFSVVGASVTILGLDAGSTVYVRLQGGK